MDRIGPGADAVFTSGDWPASVPGLGIKFGGQPLDNCADCSSDRHPMFRTTYVRYGGTPLCKTHALIRCGAPILD